MKARHGAGRPQLAGPLLTPYPSQQLPEAVSLLSHLPLCRSAGPRARAPGRLQGGH